MDILKLLIVWIATSISLLFITKLPLGVEIDSTPKAFLSAAVLGIVTAIVRPILAAIFTLPEILTLHLLSGIFTFMIAVTCFSIAAWLVEGFRLRFGIWSAIGGALALSVVNSLMYKLFGA